MGPVRKTTLTLRFDGAMLDPEEVSVRLGGAPTNAAAKGGTWVTPGGAQSVAETGRWRLRVVAHPGDELDEQVKRLFEALTADAAVWRDLCDRYRGNLFVGLFLNSPNEGLCLAPETLTAIGLRGLNLQLDIYAPDPE